MALHAHVGAVFCALRQELGVTQAEVAAKAGRKRADYSRFERGVHSPMLAHIELYAHVLGVRVSDVIQLAELRAEKKQ